MLSNFPLEIFRGFCLIAFTVQTLLCDCISRENSARQTTSCGLKGADSLNTPGHFWPSSVMLEKNQTLCVNSLWTPFPPPFLPPSTPNLARSSQPIRSLSWPLSGRQSSLGNSSERAFLPKTHSACEAIIKDYHCGFAQRAQCKQQRQTFAEAMVTVEVLIPRWTNWRRFLIQISKFHLLVCWLSLISHFHTHKNDITVQSWWLMLIILARWETNMK